MTHLPAFIIDNEIAFSVNIPKANTLTYTIDVEQLYTPHGFIVPYNNSAADIITYLEDGIDGLCLYDRVVKGLLINHKGQVFEFTIGNIDFDKPDVPTKIVVSLLRVIVGKGTRYARCEDGEIELMAVNALGIGTTLRNVVKLYEKTFVTINSKYVFEKISTIVANLKKKGFDKPFPQPLKKIPS